MVFGIHHTSFNYKSTKRLQWQSEEETELEETANAHNRTDRICKSFKLQMYFEHFRCWIAPKMKCEKQFYPHLHAFMPIHSKHKHKRNAIYGFHFRLIANNVSIFPRFTYAVRIHWRRPRRRVSTTTFYMEMLLMNNTWTLYPNAQRNVFVCFSNECVPCNCSRLHHNAEQ